MECLVLGLTMPTSSRACELFTSSQSAEAGPDMIAAATKSWSGGVGASLHHHCCCSCCCCTALYNAKLMCLIVSACLHVCVWLTLSGTSVKSLPLQCNSSTHNDCGTCQCVGFGTGMRRVLLTIHHGDAMLVCFVNAAGRAATHAACTCSCTCMLWCIAYCLLYRSFCRKATLT